MRFRSQNSDLLLPEFMEGQIRESIDFLMGRRGLPMHRVTAFVSHKCNMFCDYCTGPHLTWREGDSARKKTMMRKDLTVEQYTSYLADLVAHCDFIEHVHFTGGEATIKNYLPTLIQATTEQGVLSSITSNGIAAPSFYRSMIEKGLSEVRISLDSYKAEDFESAVHVKGAFQRVLDTIQEITRLRDENGQDVFLVLNACIGEANLERIRKTLRFLLSLNPNDLKFLLIVQDKQFVMSQENKELLKELHGYLTDYPSERYYLLRRKIDNLFNPDAAGLEDQEAQEVMKHCFIPMTERTIDGQHYYPCSIYTRWYGEPIGELDEPFEVQQEKSMKFVWEHDCRKDPICLKYCVNCCKLYNINMNLALEAEKKIIETGEIIEDTEEFSPELCESTLLLQQKYVKGVEDTENFDPTRLFLIIKPHGQPHRTEILDLLKEKGIEIESIQNIEDWASFSTHFYCKEASTASIKRALSMGQAFSRLEKGKGEIVWFRKDPSPDVLLGIKYKIRSMFPSLRYTLRKGSQTHPIHVNAVHTPDEVDLARENTILFHVVDSGEFC